MKMQGIEVSTPIANVGAQMLRRNDVRHVLFRMRTMVQRNIREAVERGDDIRAAHERRRMSMMAEVVAAIEAECPIFRNLAPTPQASLAVSAPFAENEGRND